MGKLIQQLRLFLEGRIFGGALKAVVNARNYTVGCVRSMHKGVLMPA